MAKNSFDFEEEISVGGYEHNVRWSGYYNPAQRGGMTDPSFDAYWEVDGNVEIEIFGVWFDTAILGIILDAKIVNTLTDIMAESDKQYKGDY